MKRPRPKPNSAMCQQALETASLARVAEEISSSLRYEEILGHAYKAFRRLLPYDRIGLALVTDAQSMVLSIGARSSARKLHLPPGYRAPLKGSSLAAILKTRKPRIINDLEKYLSEHPKSDSTRRIVAEGMRSSLTYPLVAQGKPVGFIFFSSRRKGAYAEGHADSFRRIATLLSLAVEKGRLYNELREADETKNRIMGVAAHDLRGPLTVLIGCMDRIQENSGDNAPNKHIAVVRRKCKQMLLIIDSLLDLSIIQSRGLELNLDRLNLWEFLRQICTDNEILAESKAISLKLELPPKLPELMADHFRLLQAFDNLISNAIKYSMSKTTITLSARVVAESVEIAVADQGQGVPPNELSLLFKEFGRASVQPTDGERSIGLGLFIAHRVVRAHGGTIRVTSRPGVGATFTVSLPLRARKTDGASWTPAVEERRPHPSDLV